MDKTNPDCENFDPCTQEHPISASFKIYESWGGGPPKVQLDKWVFYDTDTVSSIFVKFTADEKDASNYEWHIGAGIYNTRSFDLEFPVSYIYDPSDTDYSIPRKILKTVPIMLIVHKTPNKICFPDDDGIDTVIRTIKFINIARSDFEGKFYGYWDDNTTKTDTVSFDYHAKDSITGLGMAPVYKTQYFKESCEEGSSGFEIYKEKQAVLGCAWTKQIQAFISDDKRTLEMDAYILDSINLTTITKHHFKGKRQ